MGLARTMAVLARTRLILARTRSVLERTQSHDLITKLTLYMKYRVKEYWIVNPMLNSITIYALNKEEVYEQHAIKTEQGMITSKFLNGFHLELEHIFQ